MKNAKPFYGRKNVGSSLTFGFKVETTCEVFHRALDVDFSACNVETCEDTDYEGRKVISYVEDFVVDPRSLVISDRDTGKKVAIVPSLLAALVHKLEHSTEVHKDVQERYEMDRGGDYNPWENY